MDKGEETGKGAGETERGVYLTESEIRAANKVSGDKARKLGIKEVKTLIIEWLDKNYDPKRHHYFSGYFSLRGFDKRTLKYGLEFDNIRIRKEKERV
jgi:hypothetical protein